MPLGVRARKAIPLAWCAGALALSGCSATGAATFHVDGTASVDVVMTLNSRDDAFCTEARDRSEAVRLQMLPGESGETRCRLTADRIPHTELSRLLLPLGRADGRYHLTLPGALLADPFGEEIEAVDLTLTFPGPVLAASGTSSVIWNTARWTDPEAVKADGLMVVALDHPGVPLAWLAAGAGGALVSGVAAAALARRGRTSTGARVAARGPRDAGPPVAAPEGFLPPAPDAAAAQPPTRHAPEDPEVWSRPG